MKKIKYLFPILTLGVIACNLTKDVELDIPAYENRPVVECYLEPGKPMRLLLTQSFGFFEQFDTSLIDFLNNATLDSALVTIEHAGKTDTLKNQYALDPVNGRFYNYVSPTLVPNDLDADFTLNIVLKSGGRITGNTRILPFVPIDSIVIGWSPDFDTLARVLTYITDDPNTTNYYRRLLNYSSLDSFPEQDFLVDDRLNQTTKIAFGTGYDLKMGDTIYNTIFHITPDHYDFIESFQLAVFGNQNPFAQPSQIRSNVSGDANPIGIFTCLVYDRDTTIIQ